MVWIETPTNPMMQVMELFIGLHVYLFVYLCTQMVWIETPTNPMMQVMELFIGLHVYLFVYLCTQMVWIETPTNPMMQVMELFIGLHVYLFVFLCTQMVWIETPTNPMMQVVDIAAVSKVAHSQPDVFVVVDNTFATPYFQRPLELGADCVLHSISKYLNGENLRVNSTVNNYTLVTIH